MTMKIKNAKLSMCQINTLSINKAQSSTKTFPMRFSKNSKVTNFQKYDEDKTKRKNCKKTVRFSDHIDTLFIIKKSDEESNNAWYNRSDLHYFRDVNLNDIRCVYMNKTHPGKNLLKAHDAVKRGNLKSALTCLKPWCALNGEYACLRGVEDMFKNKLLLEMEEDRMLAIETVLRVQSELRECSSKHENAEILKNVYEKASINSKNFALAMGTADSMAAIDKESKSRAAIRSISKFFNSHKQAEKD